MSFLVVVKKVVVDQAAVPEVPEVPEVLDVDGVTVLTPAVPAVPAIPAVTHDEVDQSYVENDAGTVARVMALQSADPLAHPNLKFYSLKFNTALRPTIKTVREKSRAPAPSREIVTIEDQDGIELGSGTV